MMVMEGKDIAVPLESMGVGSTVVCTDRSLEECPFGTQFTARAFEQELVLMNMGRETQTVQWSNPKEQLKRARLQKAKTGGKEDPEAIAAEEVVFTIDPEKSVIKPKESTSFVIRGFAQKVGPALRGIFRFFILFLRACTVRHR